GRASVRGGRPARPGRNHAACGDGGRSVVEIAVGNPQTGQPGGNDDGNVARLPRGGSRGSRTHTINRDSRGSKLAIGTFASLINGKVIVPSTRNDYWAVNKHFLSDLLRARLGQVFVDQGWYLSRYPDVAKAIEAGSVADAAEHYRKFGYFEHRM